jgi:lariat debranching enzyme
MTTTNDQSVQEVEPKQSITVAAVGCVHGQLDKVFNAVAHYEHRNSTSVDLLVCCGDVQAVRHSGDLDSLAVPPKHKREGDFAKYAKRERDAPLPVLAIGTQTLSFASDYHSKSIFSFTLLLSLLCRRQPRSQ